MEDYPYVPSAFINTLAEEGSREDLINNLQNLWNEVCYLREQKENLEAEFLARQELS